MTKPRISDLQLEQLALDELPEPVLSEVRGAVESEPDVKARFDAIAHSNEALLEAYPSAAFKEEVDRRLRLIKSQDAQDAADEKPSMRESLQMMIRWAAVATCIVGVMTVILPLHESVPNYRTKGMQPHLAIHHIVGDRAELIDADSQAREGDLVQVTVIGAGGYYSMVFSIDGRGQVTLHYPGDEESGLMVAASKPLPNSYQLDDAPRFERFFLITHPKPIDREWILDLAQALANNGEEAATGQLEELPEGFMQWSVSLEKVP